MASAEGLNKGIAEFYDDTCLAWESIWGDHMHQGFYDPGAAESPGHRAAQVRMLEEALRFAGVSEDPLKKPKSILDVGCGVGGSSRYLAKKYGARCQGINLSPVQIERAQVLSEGLAERVSFQVADAMEQPFPDGQFDLVLSLESAEYMPDKRKFVKELALVTAPGGTIIIITNCHRDLLPHENSLSTDEASLLKRIYDSSYLPPYCSVADYSKIAESLSLENIKSADWSENVAPFWPEIIWYTLGWKRIIPFLCSGWKLIRTAFVLPSVLEGHKKNLIKYCIITCRKPRINEQ